MRSWHWARIFLTTLVCSAACSSGNRAIVRDSDIVFNEKLCLGRDGLQGDLVLRSSEDAAANQALPCLTGSLIVEASTIDELDFPALTEIGGDFIVSDNGRIERVSMPVLRLVGGSALVLANAKLSEVELPELRAVSGDLQVGRNPMVDAALRKDAPGSALEHLFLPRLFAVGGAIVIHRNPNLVRVELPALERADDGVELIHNARLQSFAFAARVKIGRVLDVGENAALEDLGGLTDLAQIPGGIFVHDNPALISLRGLHTMQAVGGSLEVARNPVLRDVVLPALTAVNESFVVLANDTLGSVQAELLADVKGRAEITNNRGLERVSLPFLVSVGGNLDFAANHSLATIDLGSLRTLGSDLGIVDSSALVSFRAPQLTRIRDNLILDQNLALEELALRELAAVGGYMTLANNAALDDLDGLPKLTAIGLQIYVRDNPKLPVCSVYALRDRLAPKRPMWGEDIAGNLPGQCEGGKGG